ncbi:hypothetical protein F4560_001944 [Saccharothrix ecbatanensis]|uniref:Uncharacterized protein n=1 Tax=Saccharothrix ecbatanensis TaxID=1105145 RepID=A0A7W9HHR9_9PSEU|nr:hypothetical protein [Saccharothrix ecbatanensis]MBB5802176.1 hypothetical protein [Saccharothrix ecbatanensis]
MRPTEGGLTSCDLRFELAAAGEDLRYYRERDDDATVELLLAWIDALLDEWNRRSG